MSKLKIGRCYHHKNVSQNSSENQNSCVVTSGCLNTNMLGCDRRAMRGCRLRSFPPSSTFSFFNPLLRGAICFLVHTFNASINPLLALHDLINTFPCYFLYYLQKCASKCIKFRVNKSINKYFAYFNSYAASIFGKFVVCSTKSNMASGSAPQTSLSSGSVLLANSSCCCFCSALFFLVSSRFRFSHTS